MLTFTLGEEGSEPTLLECLRRGEPPNVAIDELRRTAAPASFEFRGEWVGEFVSPPRA
jgi:hypothetical protein